MDVGALLDFLGVVIYAAQALTALYGLFVVVLLFRRIAQKNFSSPARSEEFLSQAKDLVRQQKFDDLRTLCDSPALWAKAVPQLIIVALDHRHRDLVKIRRVLAEKFERDVLTDFEYRMSWISTIVKTAPMLGLLGTVQGMIGAFDKIAKVSRETGTDPSQLANDISFALLTTLYGLLTAIPLVLVGAIIHVRIGRLQDRVQYMLGEFLDELDAVLRSRKGGP